MNRPLVPLPPYSGREGCCPKCGEDGATTTFHDGPEMKESPRGTRWHCERFSLAGEHLCRLCVNCGYNWPEATLNSAQQGSGTVP